MKHYDEIQDIITNKLGLKNIEDYAKWVAPFHEADPAKRRLITQADLDLLSPEVVHNGDFWEVVERFFGVDAVCSTNYGKSPQDKDSGNARNLGLARLMGALSFIDEWQHYNMPVLEIGAGYGNFKNYCLMNTAFKYAGVDVYPKTAGIMRTTPEGFLPDEVMQEQSKIQIVYSSNVFQHLSVIQRQRYFKDVASLLTKDGIFIFNLLVHYDDPANPKQRYAENGRRYLHHYGQMTEIPFMPELMQDIEKHFTILYETRRYMDYLYNFVCYKKPEPTAPVVAAEVVSAPATQATV